MLNRFFNLIRNLFIRKNTTNVQLDESYDEAIKNREHNLKLFYEIVGENPLKQIDWIIENGFEKFNKWFNSYEDGSINIKRNISNIPDFSVFQKGGYTTKEFADSVQLLARTNECGYSPASRDEKETDELLRQSLNSKDYRLYSPANQMKVEVELRGGLGNKVAFRYEEVSLDDLF